jgi:hypothetical protein
MIQIIGDGSAAKPAEADQGGRDTGEGQEMLGLTLVEALLAAGTQLAGTADLPMTVVDAEMLREDTTALLDQLNAGHHVFLSHAQAAHWPSGFTPTGVLAIHADVLLDPSVVEPLIAAAREASRTGHLLIARRPDGPSFLDRYTDGAHRLIAEAQSAAASGTTVRYEPGPRAAGRARTTAPRIPRCPRTGPVASAP